jgi:hypothetical protein
VGVVLGLFASDFPIEKWVIARESAKAVRTKREKEETQKSARVCYRNRDDGIVRFSFTDT